MSCESCNFVARLFITKTYVEKFPELSKTKAALYARLGSAKVRRKEGIFMAVGAKCVADTRQAFQAVCIIGCDEWLDANASRWPADILRRAGREDLSRISGMNSAPEVIAVYTMPPAPEHMDLKVPEGVLALALDGVQDPGNFGSILRTADWFGITTVFASHDCADLYNPKTIQATMGAVSRVRVIYVDLNEVIRANNGLPIYGTLLDGTDIYSTPLVSHALIVMGNEGRGISQDLRPKITHPVLIPPYSPESHGESLNVAAATAITIAAFRHHN